MLSQTQLSNLDKDNKKERWRVKKGKKKESQQAVGKKREKEFINVWLEAHKHESRGVGEIRERKMRTDIYLGLQTLNQYFAVRLEAHFLGFNGEVI